MNTPAIPSGPPHVRSSEVCLPPGYWKRGSYQNPGGGDSMYSLDECRDAPTWQASISVTLCNTHPTGQC